MSAAFSSLHPGIQRWIYDQRWGELRPIQVEAITTYAGSTDDLVISAPTASGKTEAAFLPILSAVAHQPGGSIRALYVGPLRALINDQFRRCEDLCAAAEIPVHRWHGEVGQAERNRLIKDPSGILLITPESIESLLINRSAEVRRLFAVPLAYVIDELHVFPGSDRGLHLRSLLHRLDLLAGHRVRRIGLSATLGDPQVVTTWLHPEQPSAVRIIVEPHTPRELRTRIHAYVDDADVEEDETGAADDDRPMDASAPDRQLNAAEVAASLSTASGMPTKARLIVDLWHHHPAGVNLVFANSKREIESSAVALRALLSQERIPDDRVLVHHGSLSRDLRVEAEQALQAGGHRICLCSSTLELGIDIGSVRAVGHIGAPWTVASLAQRLGRSGRRAGEVATLRQYITVSDPGDEIPVAEDPVGSLDLDLIRGAATMSLHLEHWCEPIDTCIRDLTVRIQQILSIIAQYNGTRADRIYREVAARNGCGPISTSDFAHLLRHLAAQDIIEQIGNGEIILATAGQFIANSREFYAVFIGGDDYRVVHGDRVIGTVPPTAIVAVEDSVTLGGRTWRVIDIDMPRRTIAVVPGRGRRLISYGGAGVGLHQHVVDRIRDILADRYDVRRMLDAHAQRALTAAQAAYRLLELDTCRMIPGSKPLIWTWLGGPATQAVVDLLQAAGCTADNGIVAIELKEGAPAMESLARAAAVSDAQLLESLVKQALPIPGKYDHLAPPEHLVAQYIARDIDVPAARAWLSTIHAC